MIGKGRSVKAAALFCFFVWMLYFTNNNATDKITVDLFTMHQFRDTLASNLNKTVAKFVSRTGTDFFWAGSFYIDPSDSSRQLPRWDVTNTRLCTMDNLELPTLLKEGYYDVEFYKAAVATIDNPGHQGLLATDGTTVVTATEKVGSVLLFVKNQEYVDFINTPTDSAEIGVPTIVIN
ncbi:MAG: hypothetical protein Unbinned1529contig1001_17 [Prokaryotic dsDNA virus sp.]|nr:MAG: hypothetical protein Unbinned1529contig1001_17 [Prokaryotic dsDNA virus sp.]|tara:strand:+ start:4672 stop:5205 length:534 start_codon:yes stop_codon:yes gene_type:complete